MTATSLPRSTVSRSRLHRELAALLTSDRWPAIVEQARRRSLTQALLEALPGYWQRRADSLATVGTEWADGAALNCRRHAWLLSQELPPDLVVETDAVLAEVV